MLLKLCNYFACYITGSIPVKIPVKNCKPPPDERLLRKIDDVFVTSLQEQLKRDPTGPGVPPLAVFCKDVAKCDDFIPHLSTQYTYEVIGGLHSVTARKQILKEHPGI